MSTYSLNIANSSGTFTPTLRRAATVATGGTALTVPTSELFAGATATTTKMLYLAAGAAMRACIAYYASGNVASAFYVTLTDDGSGNYTPAARYGGTAATGGTAITIPASETFAGATTATTLDLKLAISAAARAAIADRAAGN